MNFLIKSIAFTALILIFSLSVLSQERYDERLENLKLETKVLKIKAKQTEPNFVDFTVEVENTFTNKGEESIIILQPNEKSDDDPFWFAGITIKTKDFDTTPEYPIYSFGILPSVCGGGCWKKFDKKLDKKMPPTELTRTIRKNDSWLWKTSIGFRMLATGKNYYDNWEATSRLKTKTRATITYSIFPANSQIGEKIKKRWKSFGILFLSEDHSLITSKPFEIDLKNVTVQK